MSTWDFSAAGVNGLLNNTSKSKMKITMIPYEDIMRNEKNRSQRAAGSQAPR